MCVIVLFGYFLLFRLFVKTVVYLIRPQFIGRRQSLYKTKL